MIKILFILILPFLLFAKYNVVTYFPLESHIIKKIAQDEVRIKEISSRFIEQYREIPFSEISRLSNAKIYFHFGLLVEQKYEKLLIERNPELLVVNLSSNIQKIDENPYIWTDPFLMRDIAKNVYETFVSLDKYKKDFYKKNYENFLNEIDETFLKVKQKLNSCDTNFIYVFDDYWEYFARRFRIKTIQREKRFLNILEVPELIRFTQTKGIKQILFFKGEDYDKALSLGSNLNIELVEDNIFGDNWQFNILNLAQKISK